MDTEQKNSGLVLGAMMLGTRFDEEASFALLDQFMDAGGQWIDTADCYAFWASNSGLGGDSETVLGKWLRARPRMRERVRLSTKMGAQPLWAGSWPQSREGLSARAISQALQGSLKRIGTDYVDLVWIHQEDRSTPISETADALGKLVSAGSALRLGASNHPAWRVEQARSHALQAGLTPIDALQLQASYLQARPGSPAPGAHPFGLLTAEQSDYARAQALEVWAYSPSMNGTYDNPNKQLPPEYLHEGNTARLVALDRVAQDTGLMRGQVVLAWLLDQGIRPIIGISSSEQLTQAMDAGRHALDPQHRALLDGAY